VTGPRRERVAASIHHELTRIMQTQMHDPRRGFTTITGVEVTPDLRQARVYVSILGNDEQKEEGLQALIGARGFLRRELSHALALRRTPALEFHLDRSGERGDRIEQLLRDEGFPPGPPAAPSPEDPEETDTGENAGPAPATSETPGEDDEP
jgi:ribosome-binding factor A